MKPAVKNGILIGIVVVAGGFAAYRLYDTSSGPSVPKDYTVQGVCLSCRAEAELTQSIRERPPFACKSCNAKSVFPWFYCPTCKKRFVPTPSKIAEGIVRLPVVPTCPGCGGNKGMSLNPTDPEQKPAGDLPLPAMPK